MPNVPARRSPFDLFDWFARPEWLERFFDEPLGWWGGSYPAVDVEETPTHFIVTADMPGFRKEHVTVELRDEVLEIRGERSDAAEEKREGYLRRERRVGRFNRRIPLPAPVDADRVTASFRDGVLRVELPKIRPDTHVRQVPVE